MSNNELRIMELGKDLKIDATDWFGKFLLLGEVLNNMDKKEANSFLSDTFTMIEDEVTNIEEIVEDEREGELYV